METEVALTEKQREGYVKIAESADAGIARITAKLVKIHVTSPRLAAAAEKERVQLLRQEKCEKKQSEDRERLRERDFTRAATSHRRAARLRIITGIDTRISGIRKRLRPLEIAMGCDPDR